MKMSRAEVRTTDPVELLRRACRAWSSAHRTEWDDTHARITLPTAYITLMPGPSALSVYLEMRDSDQQAATENEVAKALCQADGSALAFHWFRS